MARSLWTIAELAWKQVYPKGKEETKNTVEEFVETAKDEYANVAFTTWLQLRNDSDLSLIENLLTRKKYEVKENTDGELYSDLEVSVFTLPRDMGIFIVQPPRQRPLIKGSIGTQNLFADDPGERSYYRLEKKIFYPEGFAIPGTKEVMITLVALDFIDNELEVPDIFAKPIRDALVSKYMGTISVPVDDTNNKNANY